MRGASGGAGGVWGVRGGVLAGVLRGELHVPFDQVNDDGVVRVHAVRLARAVFFYEVGDQGGLAVAGEQEGPLAVRGDAGPVVQGGAVQFNAAGGESFALTS